MVDINSIIKRTLIYFPIFKIIINSLNIIERESISTACTNGLNIYYNPEYIKRLTKDEQVFMLAHEIMHISLKHIIRKDDRNMEIWNYATDAVINQILVKSGLPLINGVIDCPDATQYSSEEYYEYIKNGPDCEEIMKQYRNNKKNNKSITTHEYWDKDLEKQVKELLPNVNEKNFCEVNKTIMQEENRQFIIGINNNISSINKSTQFGNVGGLTSNVDWKKILRQQKNKIETADYNLMSGEFNEEGIYQYPIQLIKNCQIEILIDTSGSVNDELVKSFLRECKNIFVDFKIKIGCFDTKFYGFHTIDKLSDLDNFIIEGRGGTDFDVAANSFTSKAKVKIIFTDGMAKMPNKKEDIIWMVYGQYKIDPLGGKVVYINENELKISSRKK